MPSTSDLEAMWRGFLHDAAVRQVARSGAPSADTLTGVGAGWEEGELAALAEVVGTFSGEPPGRLMEEALARAAVGSASRAESSGEPAADPRVGGRRRG